MNSIERSRLKGQHALLSPSNWHWLNYDIPKLREYCANYDAAQRGTRLHELAKNHIELGIRMPKSRDTLSMYINDALGYHMDPEQLLAYSYNCYGTADSISYKRGLLRVHDLKTGTTPASMNQLKIYAALYFLEHGIDPKTAGIELRIYQSNEVAVEEPDRADIQDIMDKIVLFDEEIEKMKTEV